MQMYWESQKYTHIFIGTVPDKTLKVPDAPLDVKYGYTKIYINGTYDTDQV